MLEFHYFTIGAMALMVLYTLTEFYLLRKKEMLFLLGYLVFSIASFAGQWHFFNQAYTGQRLYYEIFYTVLASLSFISFLLFAHAHLNIAVKSTRLHKIIIYAIVFLTLYIAVDLYLIFSKKFSVHLALFTLIRISLITLAAMMAVYFYYHQRDEGKYFVAGTLILLLGGTFTLMLQHNFPVERSDNSALNLTAPILYYRSGIILQSLFFLFGINKKVRQVEIRERNLKLQLENEQIQRELEKHKTIALMRASIASDLHDDIGATLSSINIYSQLAKDSIENKKGDASSLLEKISTTAHEMMNSMSEVIWSIKPSPNEAENLADRIRNLASEFLTPVGISFELKENNPVKKSLTLSHQTKRNLFLIAKEALNNIAKYSNAGHVLINLEVTGKHLAITISDNGSGFNVDEVLNSKTGNGLENMKHRAEQSGGVFELNSVSGAGTSIKATFSIDKIIY